jgi:hypothetical protein
VAVAAATWSRRPRSDEFHIDPNPVRGGAGAPAVRSPRMPEILRVGGFRFFFFSREGHEQRHIHVEQAERYAKFWLDPIELVEARGFRG